MNSVDLISMGLKNLWRRKARTFLTVLGVVIGTASIVIMISLGIAMNINFEKSLQDMGSLNIIDVRSAGDYSYDPEKDEMVKNSKKAYLTAKNVEKIKNIPFVNFVMPEMSYNGMLKAGRKVSYAEIKGIDMSLINEYDFKVKEGSIPKILPKNAMIFGAETVREFRNPRSKRWTEGKPIDIFKTRIKILSGGNDRDRGINVKPIALLETTDNEPDWTVYMNMEDLKKIKKNAEKKEKRQGGERRSNRDREKNEFDSLKVKVNDIDKIQGIQAELKEMGFEAWSLSDILTSMKKQSAGLRAVLGAIGAVSLFVAAIGITNTMVMSIYERTKEIGVMKVLGAELKDIKRLFLFESGILGFFGGVVGIMLSYLISYLLNSSGFDFLGMNMFGEESQAMSVIPLWLIFVALVFATFVGVISGYYPARRAMKLSALEAIRSE